MNRLTVIIPTKTASNLTACVRAIREHDDPGINIIVVDDGLPPNWYEPHVTKIMAGEKPFTFARNVNIGIRAAGDDDVILLNDDALLETPAGFSSMQRDIRSTSFGMLAPETNRVRQAWPHTIPFVCVLIPRRVIEIVGLLDERFAGEIDGEMVYGGEDDDYCYRVRQAGFHLGIFRECFVDHKTLPSTFRPHGGGLPINATRKRFFEIHGFEMGTR